MKNFLYSALAAGAVMSLASCSSDEPLNGVENDGSVQFIVSLDEIQSRAFGETSECNELIYTVFNEAGELVMTDTKQAAFGNGVTTATVNIQLVANEKYKVVFYAHNTDSKFSTYSQGNISIHYGNQTINSAIDDAFINKAEYNGQANQLFTADGQAKTVYLTRPFAQVNIGSNDLDNVAVSSILSGISTQLDINKGLYRSYSVLDNTVSDELTDTFSATGGELKANEDFPISGYSNLMSLYLLTDQSRSIIDARYTISHGDTQINELNLASTPVQGNYRTNIYGSLLTTSNEFNVVIKPAFDDMINVDMDDAIVEIDENGKVVCLSPALPNGVKASDLEGKGGVGINAAGQPVYFETTGKSIAAAMKECPEIYFAPNATITTSSHLLEVPATGIIVHGNGATITGGEQDFSINGTYPAGSTIDLTVSNLNGVKVWGQPKSGNNFNINLIKCSVKGEDSGLGKQVMVMVRGSDDADSKVNLKIEDCYAENIAEAIHTTCGGTEVYKNCTFKNVGIPINVAKKLNGAPADIRVIGCTFTNCGMAEGEHAAWNYAAPIRVVDNGGPADSIKLLVDKCTFSGNKSQWDILLMDYREGKTWFPVDYTIQNCTPANPTVRAN